MGKASCNCRESCSSHELGEMGDLRKVGQVLQRQDQSQYRGHQKDSVLALPPHPTSCSSQHVFLKEQEPAGTLGASVVLACKHICPCAPGPTPCACLQPFLHSGSIMAESVCALCKVSGTFLWCSVELPSSPHLSSTSLSLCFSALLPGFLSWSQISQVPHNTPGSSCHLPAVCQASSDLSLLL